MADLTAASSSFPTDYASSALVAANTPMAGSYGTTTVTSGRLRSLVDTSFSSAGSTALNYTYSGGGFYWQAFPAPNVSSATSMWTYYAIVDASSTDQSIRVGFDVNRGTSGPVIQCIAYSTDNTYTDVTGVVSTAYSTTTHAWLGWYYDATNLYWQCSSNGTSWTTMRTLARTNVTWLASQSDLGFVMAGTRTGGANSNNEMDNLNTGGTAPGAAAGSRSPQPTQGYPSNPVLRSFSW